MEGRLALVCFIGVCLGAVCCSAGMPRSMIDLDAWDETEVASWLRSINLEMYEANFRVSSGVS